MLRRTADRDESFETCECFPHPLSLFCEEPPILAVGVALLLRALRLDPINDTLKRLRKLSRCFVFVKAEEIDHKAPAWMLIELVADDVALQRARLVLQQCVERFHDESLA